MAYRLNGTDPFFRASPGAFSGYTLWNSAHSGAILLKRNAASAWHGIACLDNGGATNRAFLMEFNPSNQLAADVTTVNPFQSTATFNDTTNWMILGYTWDGTTSAGGWVWRWKIGAGSWNNESETNPGANANTISGTDRWLLGNEAGLGDDANFDVVCVGIIKSNLSQATFESLDMSAFSTWQSVFTGSGAWLIGFETISTQVDRTGNGGDEVSRSAGITLVSDPAGWSWGAAAAAPVLGRARPLLMRLRRNSRRKAPPIIALPLRDAPSAGVTASASAATAVGATLQPGLLANVAPTAALAAGSTPAPVAAASSGAAAAVAAGSAPAPALGADRQAAAATAVGATLQPVLLATVGPSAAIAVGVAPTPGTAVGSFQTASPVAAIAVGSAATPTLLVTVTSPAATANGSAVQPVLAVTRAITTALAAGSAPAATVAAASALQAALATGSAPAPLLRAIVQILAATGTGSAPAPTVLIGAPYVSAAGALLDYASVTGSLADAPAAAGALLDYPVTAGS